MKFPGVPNFGQLFCTNQFSILVHSQVPTKDNLCIEQNFPNICPYIGCSPSGNYDLVIFRRFLNFGPFFWAVLGTVVENAKQKKSLLELVKKNPSVNILVPKMHFPKMYIFGAQIESEGPF